MGSENKTPARRLESVIQAFNDWTLTFAPEFCDDDDVLAAKSRIAQSGGTVSYVFAQINSIESILASFGTTPMEKYSDVISAALSALADWAVTCEDSIYEEAVIDFSKRRIIAGGGTLAYSCAHRMALESILDRLLRSSESCYF